MTDIRHAQLDLLDTLVSWLADQYRVLLVTVIQTKGHTPRRVGSQFILREDGMFLGSVSGGCAEDDLMATLLKQFPAKPMTLSYGGALENARTALACGGQIKLALEPVTEQQEFAAIIEAIRSGFRVSRCYHLQTGESKLLDHPVNKPFKLHNPWLTISYGVPWRLLIIGAVEIAHYLVPLARSLDYRVKICDPRSPYKNAWRLDTIDIDTEYPDVWLQKQQLDKHCAVVALSHDPRYDDMALMDALPSSAFYIGALGSKKSSEKRIRRLQTLELQPDHINRLHAPIGLDINSRGAAEIAISIAGQLVRVRNAVEIDD